MASSNIFEMFKVFENKAQTCLLKQWRLWSYLCSPSQTATYCIQYVFVAWAVMTVPHSGDLQEKKV